MTPAQAGVAADGPTVLLIHGWEGRASDLGASALALHRRLLSDPQGVAAVAGFVAGSADPMSAKGELVSIAA